MRIYRFRFGKRKWVVLCLLFIGSTTFNFLQVPDFFRPRQPSFTLPNYPPLINNTGCRIPDFPLFDENTKSAFMVPPPQINCTKDQEYELWTRVDWTGGNRIQILPPEDMKTKSVRCGYQVITRANASAGLERDWKINVSPLVPVPQRTWAAGFDPKAEFVQVSCDHPGGQQVEYHAIPTLANNPRREVIQRKLDFWRGKEKDLPPNILLIGHDSTTRLNFRRRGKRMVKFLEAIDAHEMKGYVKVGYNTFPNVVPILSGYSLPEYESSCLNWDTDFQDSCPLIFSKLDQLHYITTYIENDPKGPFHYFKRGFFNKTTDFNPRPLELHASDSPPSCVGRPKSLLSYLSRAIDFARNKAPVFNYYFSFADSDKIGYLQYYDEFYARFLTSLDLSNTILFVFGDHGFRFGEVGGLMQCQFEGNLPNLWVRLGDKVKRRWPEWEEALKENELRIFSHFNFYSTLNKILDAYAEEPVSPVDAVEKGSGIPIPRRPFTPFFEPQKEDASCTDIGVPLAFCPCGGVEFLVDLNPITQLAAKFALAEINSRLKNFPCQELVGAPYEWVRGGAFVGDKKSLLVMFGTRPGNAEVQAILEVSTDGTFVQLLHSDRLNRIDKTMIASCSSQLTPWAELFCVCK